MRAVIISGGNFLNKEKFFAEYNSDDFVVCADSGLEFAHFLKIKPDLIVGDLDSVDMEVVKLYNNIEIVKFPAEKNYTDTELAIEEAIKRGFRDLILLCATGSRLDHTLANIFLVKKYYQMGVHIDIIDDNNVVKIITGNYSVKNISNAYVSLLPLDEEIYGLSLEGFKYNVDEIDVKSGSTLCISNEILNDVGTVKINKGFALLFVSND